MDLDPGQPGAARIPVGQGAWLHCLEWALDEPGTPVLLVHGLASNARLWSGVGTQLASMGHPVVAVDQRGHGRSDQPATGFDFATLTSDLVKVLAYYRWTGKRVPLAAGQSWGANVVLELAARQPDAIRAIALVDGATGDLADRFADWETCAAALAPPNLVGTSASTFRETLRTAHPDWPEIGIAGTLANVDVLPDGTIRPWLSREKHMAILRGLWEHHPSKRFADVGVPVLIVPADDPSNRRWGAVKREGVQRASEALRSSVTHWIAGDHDLHAQHPELVARLIHRATQPGFFP